MSHLCKCHEPFVFWTFSYRQSSQDVLTKWICSFWPPSAIHINSCLHLFPILDLLWATFLLFSHYLLVKGCTSLILSQKAKDGFVGRMPLKKLLNLSSFPMLTQPQWEPNQGFPYLERPPSLHLHCRMQRMPHRGWISG